MNRQREFVACDAYVARGLDYGKRLAAHYAAGGSPWSRSRSGDRGTERNPLRLAQGKIGECAAVIALGLNPDSAVRWDVSHADSGWDLRLLFGTLADVKTSFPHYKLIWSRDVNDLYQSKRFDVLISVSIDEKDFSRCWIEGWVEKREFLRRRLIADGRNCGLEPGTWFMEKADLCPIDDLFAFDGFTDLGNGLDAALQSIVAEIDAIPTFDWLPWDTPGEGTLHYGRTQ